MCKVPYTKLALSYTDQIKLLRDSGLVIENEPKALHLIEVISYYRLSGYWYPMLIDKHNHIFKPDSNFETAYHIYKFDRELRLLILRELEKIEIAVRAKMIYVLSHRCGAFWYMDSVNFENSTRYTTTVAKICTEYARSDEDFIKAFENKYSDLMPPSWMMFEVSSFGILSNLYRSLLPGKGKSRSPNYKTYFILSMIIYLMNVINPKHKIPLKFKALLEKYPNIDTRAMGFPENWQSEIFWK